MSAQPVPEPRRLRLLAALALLIATIVGLVLALTLVVLPDSAPADTAPASPASPATKPLTKRLLFVVVDGLRFDVATDDERMPNFARAMREHAHAEVWAGQVTMTTSAILSYGTGRPGRFEQILRNLDPGPPPHNNWLDNANKSGLTLMSVGDRAWIQMYGAHLTEHREDPKGASIDVDFNHLTFRDTRDLLRKTPDFMVAHFVTPDHQGHAYGILSRRYADHIRGYDAKLFELLEELPDDMTVVVTSDHGAVDSGTHGSDTPVQRRCPAFAYGPGIVKGAAPEKPAPQTDLASTLAVLMGVATPAHGQGVPIVEWLDVSAEMRAEMTCAEARRTFELANKHTASSDLAAARKLLTTCNSKAPPTERIFAGRGVSRQVADAIAVSTGIASPKAWLVGSIAVLLLALCVLLVIGRPALAPLPLALVLAALGTWAVFDVERLPGLWPGRVRGVMFIVLIGPALALVFMPGRLAELAKDRPLWIAAYLPGLLAVGYPSNVQPLAWVAVFVLGALLVRLPQLAPSGPGLLRGSGALVSIVLLLAFFLVLLRVGTKASGMMPSWYAGNAVYVWSGVIAAVAIWMTLRTTRHLGESLPYRQALGGAVLLLTCFVLRSYLPAWFARGTIVALFAAGLYNLRAGRRSWALTLGMCSYALLARLWEVPWVLSTVAAAGVVGAALTKQPSLAPSAFRHIVLLTFLFCLTLVQRLAIQGTQDFGGMDLGAGGFGDVNVPAPLVGVFLGYKYALPSALLLLAALSPLPRATTRLTLRWLFALFLLRTSALLGMLFIAGGSYWTGFRVLGELPFMLLFAVVCLACLAGLAFLRSTALTTR